MLIYTSISVFPGKQHLMKAFRHVAIPYEPLWGTNHKREASTTNQTHNPPYDQDMKMYRPVNNKSLNETDNGKPQAPAIRVSEFLYLKKNPK